MFIPFQETGTLRLLGSDRNGGHIDVNLNLYEPTLAATEFCLERLVPGGVIVFDDYCWPLTYGARTAIDEACQSSGNR
jgi:hypothetical protein